MWSMSYGGLESIQAPEWAGTSKLRQGQQALLSVYTASRPRETYGGNRPSSVCWTISLVLHF